jgi:hypothetical protein
MSKQSESQRIAELESIRTQDNGRMIDEAKTSGKTAGEVANEILLSRAKYGVDPSVMNTLVDSMNNQRGRKPNNIQDNEKSNVLKGNEESDIDLIANGININRGNRT